MAPMNEKELRSYNDKSLPKIKSISTEIILL